ncbi:hypothetical protein [Sinorhizobium fredii]|uniref:hypothetical protein n=1 Tax=Rhizobium fredii TaxID=380 RepID=UPI0004BA1085|nr:hypothetical protein [Sinorhizobium fredii]ASY70305.1 hypothetical protein SF83666_c28980 [Sinorhizobium fredii CCBAU 83666]
MTDDRRWKVTVTYLYNDGPRETVFHLEELDQLATIIEHGPDWNALVDCRITYNERDYPEGSTVEQIADAP